MMDVLLEILVWILLLTGSLFAIVGGIGLVRLPDLFSRMHGSGITDTLGAGSILLALMLHSGATLVTFKLGAVLFFLLLTSPTATHALARSALAEGIRPWTDDREDPSSSG
jgi:multicomponent Na+:H+ antiporter subunit G